MIYGNSYGKSSTQGLAYGKKLSPKLVMAAVFFSLLSYTTAPTRGTSSALMHVLAPNQPGQLGCKLEAAVETAPKRKRLMIEQTTFSAKLHGRRMLCCQRWQLPGMSWLCAAGSSKSNHRNGNYMHKYAQEIFEYLRRRRLLCAVGWFFLEVKKRRTCYW